MSAGAGQTLDKYQLIEKVGQGGMAVVYRGIDTSLRRTVAVKVLHRHLADHEEARERFEREAQAVAKLHHENILEIFDFSGNESEESYIVTEFIEGQTLKEFITEHEIKYPEIGALITVQVCRALSHAHSFGVLHRDVKPENVMIRNDGVVKLTDFGIAQMLDHHRLTVTGQLLGSPAYMAPEHVEGGKLDFRTDVFAAGIVLYQLTTGKMPFRGKNPHEILKRIAECDYPDPRQVNPMVGKELYAIISKCLAHDKDDRYADVTQMQNALEQFLAECGLNNVREELGRFFGAPVSYEMALRSRLVAALTARGRDRLADDTNAALELFNRVLTLEPDNAQVLEEIEKLSVQRRWVRLALMAGGLVVLLGAALGARHVIESRAHSGQVASAQALADAAPPDRADAARPVTDAGAEPAAIDAAVAEAIRIDAAPRRLTGKHGNGNGNGHGGGTRPPRQDPDAGATEPAVVQRAFTIKVSPSGGEYRLGEGPWQTIDGSTASLQVPPGPHTLTVRNQSCCVQTSRTIAAEQAGSTLAINLGFKPARVTPRCDVDTATVEIDKTTARFGIPRTITFRGSTEQERVEVEFFDKPSGRFDKHVIDLQPGEQKDVTCSF